MGRRVREDICAGEIFREGMSGQPDDDLVSKKDERE